MSSTTSCRQVRKSPFNVQQMHPEASVLTETELSLSRSPSMETSPNSFSITMGRSLSRPSASMRLMRVVLPAPKKPITMSTLVPS